MRIVENERRMNSALLLSCERRRREKRATSVFGGKTHVRSDVSFAFFFLHPSLRTKTQNKIDIKNKKPKQDTKKKQQTPQQTVLKTYSIVLFITSLSLSLFLFPQNSSRRRRDVKSIP